ncbi:MULTISPECIES: hypothetical protein [unclassified Sulfuricurvum]|jgi:hypothetical protein|uniref:hypothetical protein n=1 Tax=unclassified Sulfuricurvum TaxID=2632390 RepID=UPI000299929E|nr:MULTISPECIES: hypothetical protein [unclassified Sulfuricurvum]AFV98259.1 hypothetical protein B649_09735 [Candidatus Sulfuricurvum sp. RIFRC-1]HBM34789.1 hypothetical protein [Sulfuricurvum sp.]
MKRKDQMLIILELLNEIDIAKINDHQDAIPMLTMIQNRIFTIQSVIPNDSTFCKILDHFVGDVQALENELFKNLKHEGINL